MYQHYLKLSNLIFIKKKYIYGRNSCYEIYMITIKVKIPFYLYVLLNIDCITYIVFNLRINLW